VEHVDDLIAAHALHSLDADEAQRVEEHLAGCAACRAKLRELEAVAGALAYAAPRAAPPPELRTRLMEAIGPTVAAQPQPPVEQRARPARRRGPGWWPRLSIVAVPALAAAVVALAIWNVSLRNDLSSTRHSVATGVPVALPGVGNAVAAPSGAVTMYASAPAAPSGKTYEAWVIRAGKAYPAGLFGGGTRQFTLTLHVRPGDTIAVTVEPAGGRQQPSSKPVAAGHVQRI
jgi:anti-sigma-K factor RskA